MEGFGDRLPMRLLQGRKGNQSTRTIMGIIITALWGIKAKSLDCRVPALGNNVAGSRFYIVFAILRTWKRNSDPRRDGGLYGTSSPRQIRWTAENP